MFIPMYNNSAAVQHGKFYFNCHLQCAINHLPAWVLFVQAVCMDLYRTTDHACTHR